MAEPGDIERALRQAAKELPGLQTAEEVRLWWRKYYLMLGHRRLGRLLIGRPLESLLERIQERE